MTFTRDLKSSRAPLRDQYANRAVSRHPRRCHYQPVALLSLVFAFLCLYSCCAVASIAIPDPTLEAAIQAVIGDNGLPGSVDSAWLVGRDGTAGPYAGPPDGLTALGVNGETLFSVSGVTDLTGLEHAHHLNTLLLHASPLTSLTPLLGLDALHTLGFNDCALDDALLESLASASFSLAAFALVNPGDEAALRNRPSESTLYAFLGHHPELRLLALSGLGFEVNVESLLHELLPNNACVLQELHLSGNMVISLRGLDRCAALTTLQLNECGITNALLEQLDWAQLGRLTTLNLAENAITNIASLLRFLDGPLHDMPGEAGSAALDLQKNFLDAHSVTEHIPALEQAGFQTLFTMALTLAVHGEGDVPPAPGTFWHSFGASVYRLAAPRANTNQGFVGWRGAVETAAYGATVEMTEHRQLTAVFSETPADGRAFYPLTLAVQGSGQGAITPPPGRYLYRDGESVAIEASAAPGSYFAGWLFDNDDGDLDKPPAHPLYGPLQTVFMHAAQQATACFESEGHVLTLETAGQGDLSLAPGRYPLADGATMMLRVFPASGWRLRHWEDASGTVVYAPHGDDDPSFELILTESATVRAVFEQALRALTVMIETEGGASGTTGSALDTSPHTEKVAYGTIVSFAAKPADAESAFAGWYGDVPEGFSRADRLQKHINLPMTEDRTLTARFAPAEVTLWVNVYLDDEPFDELFYSNGTKSGYIRDVENIVSNTVHLGELPYAFDRWAGDLPEGSDVYNPSIMFPMDRDRRIAIMLTAKNTVAVQLGVVGNGKITPTPGAHRIVRGRTMSFETAPESLPDFLGWHIRYADGTEETAITPRADIVLFEDAYIQALFDGIGYRLWIGEPEEGGVVMPPPGVYRAAKGAVVELKAVPDKNHVFYHWKTDAEVVIADTPITRVTVNNDARYHAVFGPPGHRLEVKTGGTGAGHVAVVPENVGLYPDGATIALRAVPDPGAVFVRWTTEPLDSTDTQAPMITLNMETDTVITAVFDRADFQLTVATEGLPADTDAVLIPPPGLYGFLNDAATTVFAAPPSDSGLAFAGWEQDGEVLAAPAQSLVMNRNRRLVARFVDVNAVDAVALTILPHEGLGSGVTKPLAPGTYYFLRHTEITLSCALGADAYFGGWTGDAANDINYHGLPISLSRDHTVGARFANAGVMLTLGLQGAEGGATSPPPGGYRLAHDMTIPLNAIRTSAQWRLEGWYDDAGRRLSPYGRYTPRFEVGTDAATVIAVFQEHTEFGAIEYCRLAPKHTLRCITTR